jgi:flagellar hook-basal body complex protein FliE
MSISFISAGQISMARLNMLTQSAGIGQPGQVGGAGGSGSSPAGGTNTPGASFGDTLKKAISEVSDSQENAQEKVSAFLRGEPVELHQVMAATEEAGIALEMLIEIRNKFTEAYRTVINMQG